MATTQPPFTYIPLLPSSPNKPLLAANYKSLRLTALRLSPEAFSSTLADESALTDAQWISRLFHRPDIKTFIAVDPETQDWVAQVSLIGPLTQAAYTLPPEAGQPPVKSDEEEEKWQMAALYALPGYRGRGLGRGLCEEAFRYLVEEQEGWTKAKRVRVRIMVKPTNAATLKLYRGMGFVDAGMCTLEEALVVNGEVVPEEVDEEKYRTRMGYILTLGLERRGEGSVMG